VTTLAKRDLKGDIFLLGNWCSWEKNPTKKIPN